MSTLVPADAGLVLSLHDPAGEKARLSALRQAVRAEVAELAARVAERIDEAPLPADLYLDPAAAAALLRTDEAWGMLQVLTSGGHPVTLEEAARCRLLRVERVSAEDHLRSNRRTYLFPRDIPLDERFAGIDLTEADHEDLRRLLRLIQELNARNQHVHALLSQVQACLEDGSLGGWRGILRRWMDACG